MTNPQFPTLPDPIATGVMTRRDVLIFLRYAALMDLRLPQIKLLPGERMKLSGHLFPAAHQIALHVAQGLRQAPPALFAQYHLHPDELEGRVLRGINLRSLAHLLRDLAQRADDMALLDESTGTQDAMRVLRPSIPTSLVPGSPKDRRRLYLGAALVAWEHYQRRIRLQALKNTPPPAPPAPPAPGDPAPAPPKLPSSAQRKATRAAEKAQAARLAEHLFPSGGKTGSPTLPAPMPAAVEPGPGDANSAHSAGAQPEPGHENE